MIYTQEKKTKTSIGILVGALITILVIVILFVFFTGSESFVYSFEEDMEGWEANATDTDQPTVEWSINRTSERSNEGDHSVKLYLDNMNDKGKIWIQRSFDVEADKNYDVEVKYDFASSDFGSVNLWKIITGVRRDEPTSADDLQYHGDTGTGQGEETGYQWMKKSFDFSVESGSDGELWVFIGVWGTWETPRTYYVDDVEITITEGIF